MRDLIKGKYEKITSKEGDKINNLGMILERVPAGYSILMKAYIEDVLKYHGEADKKCI